ncbi:MAG TPA: DUF6356 family protein [Sphingomonas sp.]|nr:DUF6356 family protein [Sphingomonas sp.]
MLGKLFLDHPADLGESYGEHLREASGFGLAMIGGGLACLVHAVVPALFETRGSATVARLHDKLVRKRAARRNAAIETRTGGWVI